MRKSDLAAMTNRELMAMAREKKVAGRSSMDKAGLVAALSGGSKSSAQPGAKPAAKAEPKASPKSTAAPKSTSKPKDSSSRGESAPASESAKRADRDSGGDGAGREDRDARAPREGRGGRDGGGRGGHGGRGPRGADRDNRQRSRANRAHNDDRHRGADSHEDDGDPWNRVDAADPNYGRFLNPTQGNAGRGRQPGRGPERGRGADRAGTARNALRRSGEARRGVGYVPIHNQPDSEDPRKGRRRRGRDRQDGRDTRTERNTRSERGGRPPRQDRPRGADGEARADRTDRNDRTDRTDRNNRSDRNERQRGGGRNDRQRGGGQAGRQDRPRGADRNERQRGGGRNDRQRGGERNTRQDPKAAPRDQQVPTAGVWREKEGTRDQNTSRPRHRGRDNQRNSDPMRSTESLPTENLGAIGPVDSAELKKELAALAQSRTPVESGKKSAQNLDRELPKIHGVDRCRIMARDPYWLHAYWEITEESLKRAQESLHESGRQKRILRVHSIPSAIPAADSQPPGFFDIDLEDHSDSWYIHVGIPNRDYRVDVGLLAETGLFFPLASSNRVTTPPDQMSPDVDRDWSAEASDSRKLYEISGGSPVRQIAREQSGAESGDESPRGDDGGTGLTAEAPPGANFEVLSEHLPPTALGEALAAGAGSTQADSELRPGVDAGTEETSSFPNSAEFAGRAIPSAPDAGELEGGMYPAPTSPGAAPTSPGAAPTSPAPTSPQTTLWSTSPSRPGTTPKRAEDDFWFVLHTELVVSGATEPNAKVTIQGVPVRLRADGTFSVRFQLPDGDQTIPVIAVSQDAKFEREITPSVSRETVRENRDTSGAKKTAPRRRKKRTR